MLFFQFRYFILYLAPLNLVFSELDDFSYSGKTGPDHWPGLCQTGKSQSPIDLSNIQTRPQKELETYAFWVSADTVFYNLTYSMKHGSLRLEINPAITSSNSSSFNKNNYTLSIRSDPFQLLGFHMHTPSEHTFNRSQKDLEIHFVHKDPSGNLAVIGAIFEEQKEAKGNCTTDVFFDQFLGLTPKGANITTQSHVQELRLVGGFQNILQGKSLFQYNGSLTTPPCTENVTWNIDPFIYPVSKRVLGVLREVMGNNSRPIQEFHPSQMLIKSNKVNGGGHLITSLSPSNFIWPIIINFLLLAY